MSEPRRRVVLIDDDAEIRALVERVLAASGYDVASLGDPLQAVEFVRALDPDVVLCDISMPGLDGYGVVRALQGDPETARFPVVFLTANRDFAARVQAFRFGVVDYVTKPFTRDMLVRKLERALALTEHRSGVLTGQGEALLAGAREDSRSGVLSVPGPDGPARVVVKAGQVVEGGAALAGGALSESEFRELDARREEILAHDPRASQGGARALPAFDEVPPPLRRVLVVDDDPAFRRFLAGVLAGRGFTVYEAGDGEEGLRAALAQRPFLILTDVNMPLMDGVELCRRVRAHSLIGHTPLVFLSGWDDYKERYRGLEAGGDEYLSKFTPVRELLLRVQLILGRYAGLGRGAEEGLAGDIALVGPAGLLQVCHLTRLTGIAEARSGNEAFEARFRRGELVGARLSELEGEIAVFSFLTWTSGRFRFASGDPGEGAPLGESFDQLILEGCRRIDESRLQG